MGRCELHHYSDSIQQVVTVSDSMTLFFVFQAVFISLSLSNKSCCGEMPKTSCLWEHRLRRGSLWKCLWYCDSFRNNHRWLLSFPLYRYIPKTGPSWGCIWVNLIMKKKKKLQWGPILLLRHFIICENKLERQKKKEIRELGREIMSLRCHWGSR